MAISVNPFYHQDSGTISYLLVDAASKSAVIIDSVLDFDIASGKLDASLADAQLRFAHQHKLNIEWIFETHAHADHLSAATYLKNKTGAKTVIGKGICNVQQHFSHVYDNSQSSPGSEFDYLVSDAQVIQFGQHEITVLATPGHTDDSVSYLIDGNVFVGDTLFMPDGGTARCDFPGGDAEQLWESIERIHSLPGDTKIWVCHDYQPGGRSLKMQTTVTESRLQNIHANEAVSKADYVKMRNERDATLAVPRLLYPSLQVNLRGGRLPEPAKNGVRYISIPLTENLSAPGV